MGATAGGLVEWAIAKGKSAREAKAGARLLSADLRMVDESMSAVERDQAELAPFFVFAVPSWNVHREVLASELDKDDFLAVASAVMSLEEISKHTSDAAGRTDVERYRQAIKYLKINALRRSIASGYNALCSLTAYPRAEGLLSEIKD